MTEFAVVYRQIDDGGETTRVFECRSEEDARWLVDKLAALRLPDSDAYVTRSGVPLVVGEGDRLREALQAMALRACDAHAAVFRAMKGSPEEAHAACQDDGYLHAAVHACLLPQATDGIELPDLSLNREVQAHIDRLGQRALRAEAALEDALRRLGEKGSLFFEVDVRPGRGVRKGRATVADEEHVLQVFDEGEGWGDVYRHADEGRVRRAFAAAKLGDEAARTLAPSGRVTAYFRGRHGQVDG